MSLKVGLYVVTTFNNLSIRSILQDTVWVSGDGEMTKHNTVSTENLSKCILLVPGLWLGWWN